MKKTIFFLFLLILISCNNEKESNLESRIKDFENFLGTEQSKAFSVKVRAFELFLENNFQELSIEEAYKKYLQLIVTGESVNKKWNYEGIDRVKLKDLVETSGLRKEIYLKPDTVWIENGDIKYLYQYIENNDTSLISGGTLSPEKGLNPNLDSIIGLRKEEMTFNIYGRYIRGLELIQDSDSTLIKYIDDKFALDNVAPTILADILLNNNADFSNYFVKRIVVAEFF